MIRVVCGIARFAVSLVTDILVVIGLALCLVLASFDDESRPY